MTGILTSFTLSLRLSFDRSLTISSIPFRSPPSKRNDSKAMQCSSIQRSVMKRGVKLSRSVDLSSIQCLRIESIRTQEAEHLCEFNGKTEREDGVRKKYRRNCV